MSSDSAFISVTAWDSKRAKLKMQGCAYVLDLDELERLRSEAGDVILALKPTASPAPVPAEAAEVSLIEGPRLPMADEGQTRHYTEAEMQSTMDSVLNTVAACAIALYGAARAQHLLEIVEKELTRKVEVNNA